MTFEVQGLGYIIARIIADSISPDGVRLTTFELEYPRFIHSEFMTHRQLSKNAASSRAIPVKAMHKQLKEIPQAPVHWGKNMPGMQAKEELGELEKKGAQGLWDGARIAAIAIAVVMDDIGVHKQIVNRITEPYMQMKVVCSGTEWANFFWLRNHPDAQPEIQELARVMWEAYNSSIPKELSPGEWHLPYIDTTWDTSEEVWLYKDASGEELSLEDAIKVSVSCCAQVSYRKLDDSLEKALNIYDRLINSVPVHASPTEHQATPADYFTFCNTEDWVDGVTHIDRDGFLWSGNFKSWIQGRQLIPNNYKGSL